MPCFDHFLSDRSPAVAGMFYPSDSKQIEEMVSRWHQESESQLRKYRAAMVPHAGWIYSGRVAATVWNQIAVPKTTIILCPKHRDGGAQCAVAPWSRWLWPGGRHRCGWRWSRKLADHVPHLTLDDRPHRNEHAVEVQLPLLAHTQPESRIVAITIGRIGLPECQEMAVGLAEQLREELDNVLLVISSDMNHFADDAANRQLDYLAISALETLDPRRLFETCCTNHITMCGLLPAVIVLTTLHHLGKLQRARQVAYTTSADASGDTARVVGYAGMLFD